MCLLFACDICIHVVQYHKVPQNGKLTVLHCKTTQPRIFEQHKLVLKSYFLKGREKADTKIVAKEGVICS